MVEARRPLAMRPREELDTPLDALDNGQEGMTALMFASQTGAASCVSRLIVAKAHINAVEEEEWTALHFAAKEGHLEVCKVLLARRADAHMSNADDQTPLSMARDYEDRSFQQRFECLLKGQDANKSL